MYLTLFTSIIVAAILFIIALYVITLTLHHDTDLHKQMPPSLIRLPLIGNIHYIFKYRKPPHEMFHGIADKLGSVYTFWFGDKPIVLINDYQTAKSVSYDKVFSGRPQRQTGNIFSKGFKGIIITDYNEDFKKRSTILHKCLLNTKQSWQDIFNYEAEQLITDIQNKMNKNNELKEQNITHQLNLVSINCFWKMLFNRRLELHSQTYNNVNKMLKLLREGIAVSNLLDGFPILRRIPFANYLFVDSFNQIRDQVLREQQSEVAVKSNAVKSDAVNSNAVKSDAVNSNTVKSNAVPTRYDSKFASDLTHSSDLSDDVIDVLISDILVAGIEATRNALQWTVLNLMIYDEAREKCQLEIDTVRKGKNITLKEMHELHYLRAFISETLRLNPPSAFSVPHKTMEDANIEKYQIPKNTTLLINIHAVQRDEDIHENPETFLPERFLNDEGHYQMIDGFIPFGIGRRQCIGKHMAMEKCMYIAAKLLENFNFSKPDDFDLTKMTMTKSSENPDPYTMNLSIRNN